jgi:hypothetical protein
VNIIYCDKCGKRLSEDEAAIPTSKDGRSFCQNCAPVSRNASTRRIPGASGSTLRLTSRSAAGGKSASSERRSSVAVIAGVMVVVGLILAVVLLKSGGEPPPATKKPAPTAQTSVTDNTSSTATNNTQPPSTEKQHSPTPETPRKAAETQEQLADKAFDHLDRELDALPPTDKNGRIAKLEAFLRQYGDTMKAVRARVMLDQLKVPPPPLSETVDLNAEPAGEPAKLFNGTDISNWEFVGDVDRNAIRVENGVMEIGSGFHGRIECPTSFRSYIFEFEFFMDDAQGAYIEVHAEHAGISFNRSFAGQWVKVRVADVGGDRLKYKVLSGKGGVDLRDGSIPGRFRMYFLGGSAKKVRVLNLYEKKLP